MDALALLTPERREELKTLPPWFIQRFREAEQSQKDAQAGLEAEQGRLAKFEQLAADWEANLQAEHDRIMSIQRSRLEEAQAEVDQWKGEEQKRHGAIYRVVDDQVDTKKLELAQAQGLAEKRREQLMTLRRQIEDLQESTRLKKEQLTAMEQQKAPKTVRSRFESTVRKRLGSVSPGAPPATLPPAPLNSQNIPSSANPVDENVASNTPNTPIELSSVDIDYVPPHSIYESLEEVRVHFLTS
jgi:DNA repair exonuclease SbcCD ATPase subunit